VWGEGGPLDTYRTFTGELRWEVNRYSRLSQDNEINRISIPHFLQSWNSYAIHIAYEIEKKDSSKPNDSLFNPFRAESSLNIKSKAVMLHAMEAFEGRGGVARTHSRPQH
jgi:hypothetical protein